MREPSVQVARTRAMGRRVAFVHPVRVRSVGAGSGGERVFATDLSRGGMFLRTPRIRPEGTDLELELEVNGQCLPLGRATVAWTRSVHSAARDGRLAGFGIRFGKVPRRTRLFINRTVREAPDLDGTADTIKRAVPPEPLGVPARIVPRSATWVAPLGVVLGIALAVGALLYLGEAQANLAARPSYALTPSGWEGEQPEAIADGSAVEAPELEEPSRAAGVERALEVNTGLRIRRAFSLSSPPQVVFDVEGRWPEASEQLLQAGAVERIDVQPGEERTRVRLFVSEPVERLEVRPTALVIHFSGNAG